jgi:hypothetical protein
MARFPERTEADLFIWVWQYHRELRQQGVFSIAKAADIVARQPVLAQLWQRVAEALNLPSSRS